MSKDPVPSTHIRFTREEYEELLKHHIMCGQSIPWMMKTAYWKNPIPAPVLNAESCAKVQREMGYIGNNLNQAIRYLHSGLLDDFKLKFNEVAESFRIIRSYLGISYGDRKDSV